MKSKKILLSLILILICTVLCSCKSNLIYENTLQTNLNYNNISAGASPYWIDDNGVYFKKHNLAFDIYKTDINGETKIGFISDPSSDIQVYGNHLYFFDSLNNHYIFKEFDLVKNQSKRIASIKTEYIYNYFILDKTLIVVKGFNDSLEKHLSAISLKTGEENQIAQNIFACGISNNALHYITKNNNTYVIFKYDTIKQKTTELDSFTSDDKHGEILENVNFTSTSVLCVQENYKNNSSNIIIYNYANKTLETCSLKASISELVAFENNAFYSCYEEEKTVVYCLNIKTLKTTKIQDFGECLVNLFVASDEDVYVSSTEFDGIRRYSLDGSYKNILVTKKAQ